MIDAPDFAALSPIYWAKEIHRCEENFDYLSKTYLRIKAKNVIGFPRLALNRVQRYLQGRAYDQWKRTGWIRQVWGKTRQVGASTYCRALTFHQTAFKDHRNAFLLTHDEPTSYEMFDIDQTFYDALPEPLKPRTKNRSKTRLVFSGRNSKILIGHARNMNVGASQMNHILHMTEVARYPNPDEIQAALFPSLSEAKGADCSIAIMESTSVYGGDWFKQFAEAAARGENEYEFTFIPSWMHEDYHTPVPKGFQPTAEERDQMRQHGIPLEHVVWRRAKKSAYVTNPSLFYQEYPLCASGETRVSTPNGIIRIDACEHEKETESGRILQWLCNELGDTLTVTTALGYRLTVTPEHRLLTSLGHFVEAQASLGEEVVLRAPRFAEREFIARWSELPSMTTEVQVTPDVGRFLGYFMGDGSCGLHTISVACDARDEDVIQDVVALEGRLFGKQPQIRVVGSRQGGREVRFTSRAAWNWLRGLNALEQAPDTRWRRRVHVPEVIFRSPKRVVREFLRALFECDGTARRVGGVLLFSKYEDFLRDVQLLLLGFGITGRLGRWNQKPQYGVGYVLNLRTKESDQFHAEIGFIGARKTSRLVGPDTKRGRRRGDIPTSDRVVSVLATGVRAVYDLITTDPHTFSANGIAVHNSWEESWQLPKGTLRTFDETYVSELEKGTAPGKRMSPTSTGLKEEFAGPVEVWEMPQDGVFYDVGVDIAQGRTLGADWTVASVIRRDTLDQVAQMRLHIDPACAEFVDLVYWLGYAYNVGQMIPDITGGWGNYLLSELQRRGYPNIWRWRRRDDSKERLSSRIGFLYTQRDKATLVNNAVAIVRRGEVMGKVHSMTLIEEMRTFLNIGLDEWGAGPGNFDDTVSAWMLALLGARDEASQEAPPLEPEPPKPAKYRVHDIDADLMPADEEPGVFAGAWRV